MERIRTQATRALLGVAVAGLLLGCPSRTVLGPEDFEPAARVVESPVALPIAEPGDFALVDADDPALRAAMETFRTTGKPPVVRRDESGFVIFPFGESQPVLTCQPLRVCEIALQAGEEILDVALGDASRWHAEKMESGPADARVPHVVVKPTEAGLATNLVVSTTRRVYHVALVSADDASGGYARRARFYYPHDLVARWKSEQERARARREAEQREVVARGPRLEPEAVNFGYEVRGDRTTWRPTQVFDDGVRVYLRMPEAMRVTEAPALFVRMRDGEKALVNYRVRGTTYVVDRLFERAVLVVGTGRAQEKVEIVRLARQHRAEKTGKPRGRR